MQVNTVYIKDEMVEDGNSGERGIMAIWGNGKDEGNGGRRRRR